MANLPLKIKKIALLAGDLAVFFLSLLFALLIRHGQDFTWLIFEEHVPVYSLIYFLWLVVFYINNLYDLQLAKNNIKFYSRLANTVVINTALAIAFFYFTPEVNIAPKTVLFLDLGVLAILLFSWRQFFNFLIKSAPILSNTLLIGSNEAALKLIKEMAGGEQVGYKLVGVMVSQPLSEDIPPNLKIWNSGESLKEVVLANKIGTIITTLDHRQDPKLIQQLYQCLPFGIEFFDLPAFYESVAGKIPISTIGQIWFLENFKEKEKAIYEGVKRIADISLAIVIGLIGLVFFPFIALLIKSTSTGPVLFKQTRTGKNGKEFLAMKFRSMKTGAEQNGPQWAEKNDPRVTSIGKWLRKLRIDEIPQLINVLRGEMSFIGPRPERPEFIKLLEEKIPFYKERLLIKPGLTGWAQVMGPAYGGSVAETIEKLQLDLYYIKNRNLVLDLSIILKTIRTVLKGGGH